MGSFSFFFKGSSSSVRFSGPLLLHRNRPGQEVFSFCQASKDEIGMQFCLVFVGGVEKLLQRIQTKTVIDISYIV